MGTSAGEGSSSCATCDYGYVAMEQGLSSCTEIPFGTKWNTTSSLGAKPEMWRPYDQLFDVYMCPIAEACPRGSSSGKDLCAQGFTGPLCAICADKHFSSWSGQTC